MLLGTFNKEKASSTVGAFSKYCKTEKFHLQLFAHSHHFRGSLSSFVSVLLTSTLIPGVMIAVSLASLGPGVYTALLVPAWLTGEEEEEDYQD